MTNEKMRYWYFIDFQVDILLFTNFSYGFGVFGPQCPSLPLKVTGHHTHSSWEKSRLRAVPYFSLQSYCKTTQAREQQAVSSKAASRDKRGCKPEEKK